MNNADRLLEIIADLDLLAVQLLVDGQEGYSGIMRISLEDLMWLHKDMTEYEVDEG